MNWEYYDNNIEINYSFLTIDYTNNLGIKEKQKIIIDRKYCKNCKKINVLNDNEQLIRIGYNNKFTDYFPINIDEIKLHQYLNELLQQDVYIKLYKEYLLSFEIEFYLYNQCDNRLLFIETYQPLFKPYIFVNEIIRGTLPIFDNNNTILIDNLSQKQYSFHNLKINNDYKFKCTLYSKNGKGPFILSSPIHLIDIDDFNIKSYNSSFNKASELYSYIIGGDNFNFNYQMFEEKRLIIEDSDNKGYLFLSNGLNEIKIYPSYNEKEMKFALEKISLYTNITKVEQENLIVWNILIFNNEYMDLFISSNNLENGYARISSFTHRINNKIFIKPKNYLNQEITGEYEGKDIFLSQVYLNDILYYKIADYNSNKSYYYFDYNFKESGKYKLNILLCKQGGLYGEIKNNKIEMMFNSTINSIWKSEKYCNNNEENYIWIGLIYPDDDYIIFLDCNNFCSLVLEEYDSRNINKKILYNNNEETTYNIKKNKIYNIIIRYNKNNCEDGFLHLYMKNKNNNITIVPSSFLYYCKDISKSKILINVINEKESYIHSVAYGIKDCSIGENLNIFIQLKDKYGNNTNNQINNLVILFNNETINPEYLNNGKYFINITANKLGYNNISVLLYGNHIQCNMGDYNPCSPFLFNVFSNETDKYNYNISFNNNNIVGEIGYINIKNNIYNYGGDNIECDIINNNKSIFINRNIIDYNNGSYVINYVLYKTGIYIFKIKINNIIFDDVIIHSHSNSFDYIKSEIKIINNNDSHPIIRVYSHDKYGNLREDNNDIFDIIIKNENEEYKTTNAIHHLQINSFNIGYFKLMYNEKETPKLPNNITAESLQIILSSLYKDNEFKVYKDYYNNYINYDIISLNNLENWNIDIIKISYIENINPIVYCNNSTGIYDIRYDNIHKNGIYNISVFYKRKELKSNNQFIIKTTELSNYNSYIDNINNNIAGKISSFSIFTYGKTYPSIQHLYIDVPSSNYYISEIQEISCYSINNENEQIRFVLDGKYIDVNSNISINDFADILNKKEVFGKVIIEESNMKICSKNKSTFSIIFISKTGDIPLLECITKSTNININIIEKRKGISPISGFYILKYNNYTTLPIRYDITANELKEILLKIEDLISINITEDYIGDFINIEGENIPKQRMYTISYISKNSNIFEVLYNSLVDNDGNNINLYLSLIEKQSEEGKRESNIDIDKINVILKHQNKIINGELFSIGKELIQSFNCSIVNGNITLSVNEELLSINSNISSKELEFLLLKKFNINYTISYTNNICNGSNIIIKSLNNNQLNIDSNNVSINIIQWPYFYDIIPTNSNEYIFKYQPIYSGLYNIIVELDNKKINSKLNTININPSYPYWSYITDNSSIIGFVNENSYVYIQLLDKYGNIINKQENIYLKAILHNKKYNKSVIIKLYYNEEINLYYSNFILQNIGNYSLTVTMNNRINNTIINHSPFNIEILPGKMSLQHSYIQIDENIQCYSLEPCYFNIISKDNNKNILYNDGSNEFIVEIFTNEKNHTEYINDAKIIKKNWNLVCINCANTKILSNIIQVNENLIGLLNDNDCISINREINYVKSINKKYIVLKNPYRLGNYINSSIYLVGNETGIYTVNFISKKSGNYIINVYDINHNPFKSNPNSIYIYPSNTDINKIKIRGNRNIISGELSKLYIYSYDKYNNLRLSSQEHDDYRIILTSKFNNNYQNIIETNVSYNNNDNYYSIDFIPLYVGFYNLLVMKLSKRTIQEISYYYVQTNKKWSLIYGNKETRQMLLSINNIELEKELNLIGINNIEVKYEKEISTLIKFTISFINFNDILPLIPHSYSDIKINYRYIQKGCVEHTLFNEIVNEKQSVIIECTNELNGYYYLKFRNEITKKIYVYDELNDIIMKIKELSNIGEIKIDNINISKSIISYDIEFISFDSDGCVKCEYTIGSLPLIEIISNDIKCDNKINFKVYKKIDGYTPYSIQITSGIPNSNNTLVIDGKNKGLSTGIKNNKADFYIHLKDINNNPINVMPKNEIQLLIIPNDNNTECQYYLIYNNKKSDIINCNEEENDIENKINDIICTNAVIVRKIKSDDNNLKYYKVEFIKEQGDVPSLIIYGENGNGFRIDSCNKNYMQKITSYSNFELKGNFRLKYNDYITELIQYNISDYDFQNILLEIKDINDVNITSFSTNCNGCREWNITLLSTINGLFPLEIYETNLIGYNSSIKIEYICPKYTNPGSLSQEYVIRLIGNELIIPDYYYIKPGIVYVYYQTPFHPDNYTLKLGFITRGGLTGNYYNNRWFYGDYYKKIDENIDYYWEDKVFEDNYEYISINWFGYIQPLYSENYIFTIVCKGGIRLIINNTTLIDHLDHDFYNTYSSEEIFLNSNKLYDINIKYKIDNGKGEIHLYWRSLSQKYSIIQSSNLYNSFTPLKENDKIIQITPRKSSQVRKVISITKSSILQIKFDEPEFDGGLKINNYVLEYYSTKYEPIFAVQRIEINDLTKDNFTLIYDGEETEIINKNNISSLILQNALNDLKTIDYVNVTKEENSYYVKFEGFYKNPLLLSSNNDGIIITTVNNYKENKLFKLCDNKNCPKISSKERIFNLIGMEKGVEISLRIYPITNYGKGHYNIIKVTPMTVPAILDEIIISSVPKERNSLFIDFSKPNKEKGGDNGSPIISYSIKWSAELFYLKSIVYSKTISINNLTPSPIQNYYRIKITDLEQYSSYYFAVAAINSVGIGKYKELFKKYTPIIPLDNFYYGDIILSNVYDEYITIYESIHSLNLIWNSKYIGNKNVIGYGIEYWDKEEIFLSDSYLFGLKCNNNSSFRIKFMNYTTNYILLNKYENIIDYLELLPSISQAIISITTDGYYNITLYGINSVNNENMYIISDNNCEMYYYKKINGYLPQSYKQIFINNTDINYYNIKELNTNKNYSVRFSIKNEAGYSHPQYTSPVFLSPKKHCPDKPSNINITLISETEVLIKIYKPICDGGDIILKYRIEYDNNILFNNIQSLEIDINNKDCLIDICEFKISNLKKREIYYFRGYANNNYGYSKYILSQPIKLYSLPSAPSNIKINYLYDKQIEVLFDVGDNGGKNIINNKLIYDEMLYDGFINNSTNNCFSPYDIIRIRSKSLNDNYTIIINNNKNNNIYSNVTALELEDILLKNNMGDIEVERYENNYNGYDWIIKFYSYIIHQVNIRPLTYEIEHIIKKNNCFPKLYINITNNPISQTFIISYMNYSTPKMNIDISISQMKNIINIYLKINDIEISYYNNIYKIVFINKIFMNKFELIQDDENGNINIILIEGVKPSLDSNASHEIVSSYNSEINKSKFIINDIKPNKYYIFSISSYNGYNNIYGESNYSYPYLIYISSIQNINYCRMELLDKRNIYIEWNKQIYNKDDPIKQYIIDINEIDDCNAEQLLTLSNISNGEYTLKFNSYETKYIKYNCEIDELKSILEEIPNIGELNITKQIMENVIIYDIIFLTYFGEIPKIEIGLMNFIGNNSQISVEMKKQCFNSEFNNYISFNIDNKKEVQEILISSDSNEIDGYFTLKYSDNIVNISPLISEKELKDILEKFEGINEVNVEKICHDQNKLNYQRYSISFLITFLSNKYKMPNLLVNTIDDNDFSYYSYGGSLTGINTKIEIIIKKPYIPSFYIINYEIKSNKKYYARISIVNSIGKSTPYVCQNSIILKNTPPSSPQNFIIKPYNSNTVLLYWEKPKYSGYDSLIKYKIEYSDIYNTSIFEIIEDDKNNYIYYLRINEDYIDKNISIKLYSFNDYGYSKPILPKYNWYDDKYIYIYNSTSQIKCNNIIISQTIPSKIEYDIITKCGYKDISVYKYNDYNNENEYNYYIYSYTQYLFENSIIIPSFILSHNSKNVLSIKPSFNIPCISNEITAKIISLSKVLINIPIELNYCGNEITHYLIQYSINSYFNDTNIKSFYTKIDKSNNITIFEVNNLNTNSQYYFRVIGYDNNHKLYSIPTIVNPSPISPSFLTPKSPIVNVTLLSNDNNKYLEISFNMDNKKSYNGGNIINSFIIEWSKYESFNYYEKMYYPVSINEKECNINICKTVIGVDVKYVNVECENENCSIQFSNEDNIITNMINLYQNDVSNIIYEEISKLKNINNEKYCNDGLFQVKVNHFDNYFNISIINMKYINNIPYICDNKLSFQLKVYYSSAINIDYNNVKYSSFESALQYYVRVKAINSIGEGKYGYSKPFYLSDKPLNVNDINVYANRDDKTSLKLIWKEPISDNGNTIKEYLIYIYEFEEIYRIDKIEIENIIYLNEYIIYYIKNVNPGNKYIIYVSAVNDIGESIKSKAIPKCENDLNECVENNDYIIPRQLPKTVDEIQGGLYNNSIFFSDKQINVYFKYSDEYESGVIPFKFIIEYDYNEDFSNYSSIIYSYNYLIKSSPNNTLNHCEVKIINNFILGKIIYIRIKILNSLGYSYYKTTYSYPITRSDPVTFALAKILETDNNLEDIPIQLVIYPPKNTGGEDIDYYIIEYDTIELNSVTQIFKLELNKCENNQYYQLCLTENENEYCTSYLYLNDNSNIIQIAIKNIEKMEYQVSVVLESENNYIITFTGVIKSIINFYIKIDQSNLCMNKLTRILSLTSNISENYNKIILKSQKQLNNIILKRNDKYYIRIYTHNIIGCSEVTNVQPYPLIISNENNNKYQKIEINNEDLY